MKVAVYCIHCVHCVCMLCTQYSVYCTLYSIHCTVYCITYDVEDDDFGVLNYTAESETHSDEGGGVHIRFGKETFSMNNVNI